MKTCSKCHRELYDSHFVKSSRYLDGFYPSCKECRRDTFIEFLIKNPLCVRCKSSSHMPSGCYCSPCLIAMRHREKRPPATDWKHKRTLCGRCGVEPREIGRLCKICRIMCPKCNLRERASSSVWCQVCINGAAKPRRVKRKGTWYKSRTPLEKHKAKARKAVSLAVQLGVLKRKPCEVCGKLEVHAHHHAGYDRENQLNVRWLCPEHHKALGRWEKFKLTAQHGKG